MEPEIEMIEKPGPNQRTKKVIIRFLWIFWLFALTFLAFRIGLLFFGANPNSIFSIFVYIITDLLLLPFTALFPNFVIAEDAIFDAVAFAGLVTYLLLIPVFVVIVTLFFNAITISRKGEQAVS